MSSLNQSIHTVKNSDYPQARSYTNAQLSRSLIYVYIYTKDTNQLKALRWFYDVVVYEIQPYDFIDIDIHYYLKI